MVSGLKQHTENLKVNKRLPYKMQENGSKRIEIFNIANYWVSDST